jgi:hypothetical protein
MNCEGTRILSFCSVFNLSKTPRLENDEEGISVENTSNWN